MPHLDGEKIRQSIRFTVKELPAIKSWEVGRDYKIELGVTQVSQEKGDLTINKLESVFEINSVKAINGGRTKAQQKVVEDMGA